MRKFWKLNIATLVENGPWFIWTYLNVKTQNNPTANYACAFTMKQNKNLNIPRLHYWIKITILWFCLNITYSTIIRMVAIKDSFFIYEIWNGVGTLYIEFNEPRGPTVNVMGQYIFFNFNKHQFPVSFTVLQNMFKM